MTIFTKLADNELFSCSLVVGEPRPVQKFLTNPQRGKHYFMKDSDLAERAKEEKVARTARYRAEAFAKGTLLELLESMPSDDKEKFASKGIIFALSSI